MGNYCLECNNKANYIHIDYIEKYTNVTYSCQEHKCSNCKPFKTPPNLKYMRVKGFLRNPFRYFRIKKITQEIVDKWYLE